MVTEDAATKVLEYLKKHGQTNTFRLASELGVDRPRILNIVKKLEEKEAVEVRSGIVFFLKFPVKEKKIIKVKKAPSKPKKKVKYKVKKIKILEDLKAENKRLKTTIEELKQKDSAPPKIIRIIKKVPVKSRKLKEQAERIKKLEETIKELQQKAETPKIIRKTVIKKVPVKVKEELPKKEVKKPKKFKLPKINLLGLGKNIKRLHVPEILKK